MTKRRTRRPWGGGSITQTGANRWKVRFDGPPAADGKRRQTSERFDGTKLEAERYLAGRLHDRDRGTLVDRSTQTLDQYLAAWLNGRGDDISPRNLQGYKTLQRAYISPTLGDLQLQRLQPMHVEEMLQGLRRRGIGAQTALHAYRMLSTALSAAYRLGIVTRNVMTFVDRPKVHRKEPVMWTSTEFDCFLQSATESEFRDLFVLAAHTGMRRSELCGLRYQNIEIDWEDKKVKEGTLFVRETLQRVVGKGLIVGEPKSERSKRRIKLGANAVMVLKRTRVKQLKQQLASGGMYAELDYVFTDALGQPYDSDRASKEFMRIVRSTPELPSLPLHSLRHLHASMLIAGGTHLRVIAERLGHSSTALTADRYGHLFPDSQDEAAAAIDAALGTG